MVEISDSVYKNVPSYRLTPLGRSVLPVDSSQPVNKDKQINQSKILLSFTLFLLVFTIGLLGYVVFLVSKIDAKNKTTQYNFNSFSKDRFYTRSFHFKL